MAWITARVCLAQGPFYPLRRFLCLGLGREREDGDIVLGRQPHTGKLLHQADGQIGEQSARAVKLGSSVLAVRARQHDHRLLWSFVLSPGGLF